jgi:hypothetical protein
MMAKLDSLASQIDARQAKTEANREDLMATMKANQERGRSPDGC